MQSESQVKSIPQAFAKSIQSRSGTNPLGCKFLNKSTGLCLAFQKSSSKISQCWQTSNVWGPMKSSTHKISRFVYFWKREMPDAEQWLEAQGAVLINIIYKYIYILWLVKTPIPLAAPPSRAFSQAPQLKVAMRTFQVDGLDSALRMAFQAKVRHPGLSQRTSTSFRTPKMAQARMNPSLPSPWKNSGLSWAAKCFWEENIVKGSLEYQSGHCPWTCWDDPEATWTAVIEFTIYMYIIIL